MGVGAGREAPDAARPAPRPQHRVPDGRAARSRWSCGIRTCRSAASIARRCERARLILWKGHCSVHTRFSAKHIEQFRQAHPGRQGHRPSRVHASTSLQAADDCGSTEYIIRTITNEPGRIGLGGRHRDPSRQPAGARTGPGAHGRDARHVRLPLLDDVPHLAESSALGARRPRRRRGPQPRSSCPSRRRPGRSRARQNALDSA